VVTEIPGVYLVVLGGGGKHMPFGPGRSGERRHGPDAYEERLGMHIQTRFPEGKWYPLRWSRHFDK